MILALDLGLHCGFAISTKPITHGTIHLKEDRFQTWGHRFIKFRQWLEEQLLLYGVSEVVFEAVRKHSSTDAAHMYGALMGSLTSFCAEHEIPYSGVGVGTIKKYISGKGNASKEQVLEAVRARGFAPEDDNAADALALLLYRQQA